MVIAPQEASASGLLYTKFGGDYGQPAMGSPYAVYFNPAAIADAPGTQLVVDVMAAYRYASYVRPTTALSPGSGNPGTDPTYIAANTGRATSSGVQGAPYLGITTDFGTKTFFAGFASYVPEGGFLHYQPRSSWDGNQRAPGAVDGAQRWSVVSGAQISWWNTLALGVNIVPERLSFGVSASLVRDTLQSLIARNRDSSDDLSTPGGTPTEGRSLIDVSGTHLAIGAGLFWRPTDDGKLRLGLSYMSGQGLGASRFKGTLSTQFGVSTDQKQDVDLLQRFPDIIRFGAAYRAARTLDLRFDMEYVRWSTFKRQCVVQPGADCAVAANGAEVVPAGGSTKVLLNLPRGWRDAVGVRVGAGYWVAGDTELTGSVGIDTSAVPAKSLDATYMDSFKVQLSIGLRQRLSERYWIAGTLSELYFLPVDNSDSAQSNTLQGRSKSPSTGGQYSSAVTFLDLAFGAKF